MDLYQTLQVLIGGQVKGRGQDPSQQPTNQNKRWRGGERGRGLWGFETYQPLTHTHTPSHQRTHHKASWETLNTPPVVGGVRTQPIRILVKLPATDLLPPADGQD